MIQINTLLSCLLLKCTCLQACLESFKEINEYMLPWWRTIQKKIERTITYVTALFGITYSR